MPPRRAEEPPNDDAGRELYWESKGLPLGAGEMSSPKGFDLLSGVPGRIGVVAAETCEASLPLYLECSMLECGRTNVWWSGGRN